MIQIRPASAADADALQRIYAHSVITAVWLPDAAKLASDFASVSIGETIYVALNDEAQILGFVSVQVDDPFIHHLFVAASARGQGVGARLLQALDGRLAKPWRLKCVCANVAAMRFYLRNGWQQVGEGESVDGAYIVLGLNGK